MVGTPPASVSEIAVRIIKLLRAATTADRAVCRLAVAIGSNSLYEGSE